jgi:hypothetical protein
VNLGRRNLIINGNFQVWQRGTSFSATGTIYSADRWESSNGNPSIGISRGDFSAGQTEVPNNPMYYIQAIKNANSAAQQFRQKIENVRLSSGVTLTLSFYWNSASTPVLDVFQNFGTGGSTQVQTHSNEAITLVSSGAIWDKYKVTFTMPSISGKTVTDADSYTLVRIKESVASTNDVSLAQVQLEVGSVATPFEHRSYGEELALCQRYFQKSAPQSEGLKSISGIVFSRDGTLSAVQRYIPVRFVQTMRTTPTVTIYDEALTTGVLTQDSTNGKAAFTSTVGDQAMMVYGPSGLNHYSTRFGYYLDAEL